MTQESLTEKLATHLMRPVDEATRKRARLHLLDWLGCVAGARQSDLANRILHKVDIEYDEIGMSRWLGNVLEMDDVHRTSILHPGPIVWPAALAASDKIDEVLDQAIRGYEATITIGATFDKEHYGHYHNTATAGAFGAVAAHWAYDNDRPQEITAEVRKMTAAFGLVGSMASGLWQMRNEVTDTKQWHIVSAYNTAHDACCYAWDGIVGPRYILEGPQGLYAATCNDPKPMEFRDQWRINEVSFKPWGACRHAHPAIDATLELKRKAGSLDGEILIETYADAMTFCDNPNPETVLDAKFSIQHAVAIVASKGVPELADFEQESIAKFAASREPVTVRESSVITSRYPEHYGARVSCGGESVELIDTLGDPERPMSNEQVIGKARALIAWGGLSDKEADRAVRLALESDDVLGIQQMLSDWLS